MRDSTNPSPFRSKAPIPPRLFPLHSGQRHPSRRDYDLSIPVKGTHPAETKEIHKKLLSCGLTLNIEQLCGEQTHQGLTLELNSMDLASIVLNFNRKQETGLKLAFIQVQLFTDSKTYKLLGKEHALIIPNHRHDVDWLVVWTLAQYFGCLGSAPVISKDSSKFFPVLGWSTWFSDFVYLKRNWNKDEGVLKSSLQALKDFPRPFWLIFFVEGTRLTQKKLLAAQEYAASTGIHVPKNVLVPRTKGFVSTVKYIRSYVPAVYDVTLAVPKNVPPPSVKGMFSKQASLVKVYIKRYPVEELPKSDEGIAEWCRDRFVAKDAFLDIFLARGTFGDQKYYDIQPKKSLYVAIFWIGALLLSIYKLFQTCSPLSSWKGIGITAATLFIVEMLMYVLLLSTEQEQSTPEKQAASPKTSPNKE